MRDDVDSVAADSIPIHRFDCFQYMCEACHVALLGPSPVLLMLLTSSS